MTHPSRIILIDDDSINNMMSRRLLGKADIHGEVVDFIDPGDGLEYISTKYAGSTAVQTPTVLLLDLNMPYMDGWEFLEQFEKLDTSVKKQFSIYILTSSIDDRDKKRAENSSLVRGYIEKPLTVEKLMQLFNA